MKKVLSLLIIMSIFTFNASAFNTYGSTLSFSQHSESVAEIMKTYVDNPDYTKKELSKLGISLISEPTIQYFNADGSTSTKSNDPTDCELIVYGYTQGTTGIYHLQWLLTCKKNFTRAKPLDYISLEWNTEYGSYYASSGDSNYSTVQAISTGIVLFNVEDYNMNAGDSSYGTVEVRRIKSGELFFGSRYTHSYKTTIWNGTINFAFVPSTSLNDGLQLSFTMGYQVSHNTNVDTWQIWTDNAALD